MSGVKNPSIRVVHPSSPDVRSFFNQRKKELTKIGLNFLWLEPSHLDWHYHKEAVHWRLEEFLGALFDPEVEYIWAARGGYGATDLLSELPWRDLKETQRKWIVGFSDISALQSAFYTKLSWPAIHAPMPATVYWSSRQTKDQEALLSFFAKKNWQGNLVLEPLRQEEIKCQGELFGGCLSVLASLVGSPYLPKSFCGKILFIEDIGETPGQILRYWNQMSYAKMFDGVSGIILGSFAGLHKDVKKNLLEEMARRVSAPVWHTDQIGHTAPNWPLVIGSQATVTENMLSWKYKKEMR